MAINFNDPATRNTYALRTADHSWKASILEIMNPHGTRVADIGCGGGIYSTGWLELGADSVVGVDFSEQMIQAAETRCDERPNLSFVVADAATTGLPSDSCDVVFQRALIHHLTDLEAVFKEAMRLLVPGGTLIIQDRTMDDVLRPGTSDHLRGYFFEAFPRLLAFEEQRRPRRTMVTTLLRSVGYESVKESTLPERRKSYPDIVSLQRDLEARIGRSILHELSDAELTTLIDYISAKVSQTAPLDEIDYWTVWSAIKPTPNEL